MSSHSAHDHEPVLPHHFPVDRDFGRATLGKIGMWVFLLSDALMFGGFLLGYGLLRSFSPDWWVKEGPGAEPSFGLAFTAALTSLLIISSVTMVLAYAAALERNRKKLTFFLALTALGGMLFLAGQYKEYFGIEWLGNLVTSVTGNHGWGEFISHGLTDEGLVLGQSQRASTFYVITTFHGMHVFTGVCYLLTIMTRAWQGKYDNGNYNNVEIVGLFWHFVDLVWILVFTFVYLL